MSDRFASPTEMTISDLDRLYERLDEQFLRTVYANRAKGQAIAQTRRQLEAARRMRIQRDEARGQLQGSNLLLLMTRNFALASMNDDLQAALTEIRDLHRSGGEGMGYRTDGRYGEINPVCTACGTPDEYGEPWPCATRRLCDAVLIEEVEQ